MSDRRHGREDDREEGRGEKRHRDNGDADAGGGTETQELSMSVEDTNKMRAALGLKPLKTGPSKTTEREATEKKRHTDERQRKEREQEANEHRARIEAQREKRTLDEKLRRTRKLGLAMDEEEDDMAAWVAKSRVVEEQQKLEADKRAAVEAAAQAKLKAKRADSDEEGDYSAAELAGMKVKHGYGDLVEGETVILTLADRAILNERGELNEGDEDEELENVLKAEDRKRNKARRAATKKGKPLFGEDGKKQSLLDKYDEEEEEATLRLDTGGGVVAEQQRRQEEIRRKLAAGNAVLESAATPAVIPSATSGSDFYTQSEVAAFAKPKRKKKDRKLRTKTGAEGDDEQQAAAGGGTEDLMAMLEAEAEAAGGADRGTDLGTRGEGLGRRAKKAQEQADAVLEKRARFDAALEKANWASMALRPAAAASTSGRGAAEETIAGVDDADDELFESLSRARRQAQQQQQGASTSANASGSTLLEDLAASAAERREADEAALRAQLAAGAEVYTEATEFVRNIGADHSLMDDVGTTATAAARAAAAATAAAAAGGSGVRSSLPPPPPGGRKGASAEDERGGYMGMDVDDNEGGDGPTLPPAKWGAWVTAEEAEQAAEETQQQDKAKQRSKASKTEAAAAAAAAAEAEDSVTRERNVGKGLSSVLALLHEKGDLSDRNKVVWAGRTNDMKPVMLIGLEDVYQGGGHDERMARSIEMALTQTDVLGRVMTPKQRFREQCYRFHGIFPSKNQQEKRMRKEAEAVKTRQAATSENPSAELDRLQTIQKQTGKAHVVLSGKDALKPQSVKPPSGLGGGVTPVVGDRKVEMMLGIKKQHGAGSSKDMPPPPARKPA